MTGLSAGPLSETAEFDALVERATAAAVALGLTTTERIAMLLGGLDRSVVASLPRCDGASPVEQLRATFGALARFDLPAHPFIAALAGAEQIARREARVEADEFAELITAFTQGYLDGELLPDERERRARLSLLARRLRMIETELDAGRLSPDQAARKRLEGEGLRLVARAARAVEDTHRRRYLHRDVTPSNVLLRADPAGGPLEPVLTDFDLARKPNRPANRSSMLRVTPAYAAPELTAANGAPIAESADVYALAKTALFVIHGEELPLQAHVEVSKFIRDQHEVNGPIKDVLRKALSPTPTDRHASAEAFGQALERALDSDTTGAIQRTVVFVVGVLASFLVLLAVRETLWWGVQAMLHAIGAILIVLTCVPAHWWHRRRERPTGHDAGQRFRVLRFRLRQLGEAPLLRPAAALLMAFQAIGICQLTWLMCHDHWPALEVGSRYRAAGDDFGWLVPVGVIFAVAVLVAAVGVRVTWHLVRKRVGRFADASSPSRRGALPVTIGDLGVGVVLSALPGVAFVGVAMACRTDAAATALEAPSLWWRPIVEPLTPFVTAWAETHHAWLELDVAFAAWLSTGLFIFLPSAVIWGAFYAEPIVRRIGDFVDWLADLFAPEQLGTRYVIGGVYLFVVLITGILGWILRP